MASKNMQEYLISKGLIGRGLPKNKTTQQPNMEDESEAQKADPLESFLELPIERYGGMYLISKEGLIYSKYSNKVIKNNLDKHGYLYVILTDIEGGHHREATHILCAKTYLPNPDNLPVVDHINGNKQCPNVNNLEWVTQAENTQRAYDLGLTRRNTYKIMRIDNNGVVLQTYDNVQVLTNEFPEYKINGIRVACRKGTLYKGFFWKYANK